LKVAGATLVISNLVRLSGNAALLLALPDSGVRFVAVDMPAANYPTVGIIALVARAECMAISRRTKKGAGSGQGPRGELGNPIGASSQQWAGKGGAALNATVSANAAAFVAAWRR
jgi:hypothetical protein